MTNALYRGSPGNTNFKNARLLIIEDNPDHGVLILNAVRQCLPELKVILTSTEDEATAYLDQCRLEEWELPRLILMDLYMPDRQTGWRLLEYVKTTSIALSKIPVVLLSNSSDRSDIAEAYDRGCSSYLVKPTRLEEWLAYFQTLREYWWETVTLPKNEISLF